MAYAKKSDKNITIGSEVILITMPEDPMQKEQSYWNVILTKTGWFKIRHSMSGRYLTAKSSSKLTIDHVKGKSRIS